MAFIGGTQFKSNCSVEVTVWGFMFSHALVLSSAYLNTWWRMLWLCKRAGPKLLVMSRRLLKVLFLSKHVETLHFQRLSVWISARTSWRPNPEACDPSALAKAFASPGSFREPQSCAKSLISFSPKVSPMYDINHLAKVCQRSKNLILDLATDWPLRFPLSFCESSLVHTSRTACCQPHHLPHRSAESSRCFCWPLPDALTTSPYCLLRPSP